MNRRLFLGASAAAAAPAKPSSETLVTSLYKSLNETQRGVVCFPFDHPLRSKVDANWFITPKRVGNYFNAEQRDMIEQIFRGLHSPEFADRAMQHMVEDGGAFGNSSIALFGEPGSGKFEFVLTGRHCTARCDGDSVDGAAFGGPIFYGHQAGPSGTEKPDHPGNVYWFQAKRANEVFSALDGKQRAMALIDTARKEDHNNTVALKPKGARLDGLPVAAMSRDQKQLVRKVLADLLLPFRKQDVDEAMKYINVDTLAMSFSRNLDLGNDQVWDVWQLESSNMVWYFRGFPHVHTWVNIQRP